MNDDDWKALIPSLENPKTLEEQAAAIAEELRKGNPSKLFCGMLAGMIDQGGKNSTPFVLNLRFKRKGQPRVRNVKLGSAMIEATEGVSRGRLKAIKEDVAAKFGVTVRTAESAMKQEREWREQCALLDSHSAKMKINPD